MLVCDFFFLIYESDLIREILTYKKEHKVFFYALVQRRNIEKKTMALVQSQPQIPSYALSL